MRSISNKPIMSVFSHLLNILDFKLMLPSFLRRLFRSINNHYFLQQYFKLLVIRVQFES